MGNKRLTSDDQEFLEGAEEAIEGQFEDVSGLQDDLDGQLHAIFADTGGDPDDTEYEIRVYRPQPGKGALGYLFACLPAELPIMDKLRDDYGGGNFEVRILRNRKLYRRRVMVIEPPLKKPEQPMIDATANLGEVMTQGFMGLGKLILQDNAQPAQHGNSMREMLENMALMRQAMGEPAPAANPMKMLKDVFEIQSAMGGGGGDKSETNVNDVLLSMAETILPKLAEAGTFQGQSQPGSVSTITGQNGGQEMPQGASVVQAVPGVPENVLQNPTQKITPQNEKPNPMKMHLIFLCAQAKMNRDPATYANMVLDNTPDEKLDELVEFMTAPNALETMGKAHKGVLNHPEWFAKLGKEILAQLIDSDQPDESEPGNVKEGELLTPEEKPAINADNVSDDETAIDPNNRPPVGDTERESGD